MIKDRDDRIRFMQAFNWVPDRIMLSVQYLIKTGRTLNWRNPQRFTEKLQVYKIISKNNSLMARCADKCSVRDYVAEKNLSDILIPLVGSGVYESPDDIDWDTLPERFVIKDTLGSGGNAVIVCDSKANCDKEAILSQCEKWVNCRFKHAGREHIYDANRHRIIIESYLDSSKELEGLVDYKFFCFDGNPKFLYVISDRVLGKEAVLGIYDIDFNLLPFERTDEKPSLHPLVKPQNYERMIEISRILSDGFPEVRVDLYDIDGNIYFGEMTFFDGSGYMTFKPDEFDKVLGENFVLSR